MRAAGRGAILFTTGGAAINPYPARAGVGISFAGEVAYARMLHDALADTGVHVALLHRDRRGRSPPAATTSPTTSPSCSGGTTPSRGSSRPASASLDRRRPRLRRPRQRAPARPGRRARRPAPPRHRLPRRQPRARGWLRGRRPDGHARVPEPGSAVHGGRRLGRVPGTGARAHARSHQRRLRPGRHPRPAVRAALLRPRLRVLPARAPRTPGRGPAHARRARPARGHRDRDRGRPRLRLLPPATAPPPTMRSAVRSSCSAAPAATPRSAVASTRSWSRPG